MKLTWHIVKKDLRALRWPLLFWGGLIAAKLAIGVVMLTTDGAGDVAWIKLLDGLAKSLAALEGLGVVLVAALIHEDKLVGSSAFWVTRPIAGARLLAAKLLGLAIIFVVIPVVVTVPWWLGCHLTAGQLAGAAVETIVLHLLVVLLGLLWAVVTDGFGRFLLWTLALVAAVPLALAVIISYFGRHNLVIRPDVATTRFAVVAGVVVLGVAAVAVHQFLTRRLWRSVSLIGAMLGVIVAVALWWPWGWGLDRVWHDYLARQAEKAWPVGGEPPGLTFTPGKAEFTRRPDTRPDSPVQLRLTYRVNGVPANQALLPGVGDFSLRWADGKSNQGWSWLRTGWDLQVEAARIVRGLPPENDAGRFEPQALQSLPAPSARRLEQEPATYVLHARFALVEAQAPVPVPLAPGGWTFAGPAAERIAAVEKSGEAVWVTFVRHHPAPLLGYFVQMGSFVLGAGQGIVAAPPAYVLVDRARDFTDLGANQSFLSSRVAGVEVNWETRSYRAMKADGSAKPRLVAMQALEEAAFERVVFATRAAFTHELKIDRLSVALPAGN